MLLKGLAVGLMGSEHCNYFSDRFTDDPTELFRIFRYPEHRFGEEVESRIVSSHSFSQTFQRPTSGACASTRIMAFSPSCCRTIREDWKCAAGTGTGSRLRRLLTRLSSTLETVWRNGLVRTLWSFAVFLSFFFTAGRYRATPHRVRNLALHDRYSFPFFFDPNFSASLQPIDEKLLSHHRKLEKRERWDKADMEDIGQIAYGDYVLSKVLKVFPQLGDSTAVAKQGASLY
jgi:hypothetical protein